MEHFIETSENQVARHAWNDGAYEKCAQVLLAVPSALCPSGDVLFAGRALYRAGEVEKGLALIDAHADRYADADQHAAYHALRGNALARMGYRDKSEEEFRSARRYLPRPALFAYIRNFEASIAWEYGDIKRAQELLKESCDDESPLSKARRANLHGAIAFRQDRYQEAKAHLELSLSYLRQSPIADRAAERTTCVLTSCLNAEFNTPDAGDAHTNIDKYFHGQRPLQYRLDIAYHVAQTFLARNDFDRAIKQLYTIQALAPNGIMSILAGATIADIYRIKGQTFAARNLLNAQLDLVQKIQSWSDPADRGTFSLAALSRSCARMEMPKEAKLLYRMCRQHPCVAEEKGPYVGSGKLRFKAYELLTEGLSQSPHGLTRIYEAKKLFEQLGFTARVKEIKTDIIRFANPQYIPTKNNPTYHMPPNQQFQPQRHMHLTPRERSIYNLLVDGLSRKDIAERLGLSPNTIRNRTDEIYDVFGVHTQRELMQLHWRQEDKEISSPAS